MWVKGIIECFFSVRSIYNVCECKPLADLSAGVQYQNQDIFVVCFFFLNSEGWQDHYLPRNCQCLVRNHANSNMIFLMRYSRESRQSLLSTKKHYQSFFHRAPCVSLGCITDANREISGNSWILRKDWIAGLAGNTESHFVPCLLQGRNHFHEDLCVPWAQGAHPRNPDGPISRGHNHPALWSCQPLLSSMRNRHQKAFILVSFLKVCLVGI